MGAFSSKHDLANILATQCTWHEPPYVLPKDLRNHCRRAEERASSPQPPRSSTSQASQRFATSSPRTASDASHPSRSSSMSQSDASSDTWASCAKPVVRGADKELGQEPQELMVRCSSPFRCRLPYDLYKKRIRQKPCQYNLTPGVARCRVCHSPLLASPLTITTTATAVDSKRAFMEVAMGRLLTKTKAKDEAKEEAEKHKRMVRAIRDYHARREREKPPIQAAPSWQWGRLRFYRVLPSFSSISASSASSSSSSAPRMVSRCSEESRIARRVGLYPERSGVPIFAMYDVV